MKSQLVELVPAVFLLDFPRNQTEGWQRKVENLPWGVRELQIHHQWVQSEQQSC